MESVNGYLCRTCSDVSIAKKGLDPADGAQAEQKAAERRDEAKKPDAASQTDPTRLLDVVA